MNYHLITLGCAKNIADSEGMSTLLRGAGHHAASTPDDADLLIVNTCGFLQAARDESVDVLGTLGVKKRDGQILVAAGCLSERIGAELVDEVPWLDGVIGTQQWPRIVELVDTLRERRLEDRWRAYVMPSGDRNLVSDSVARRADSHTAYLKIADGCSAPCTFCTIPSFKGKQRSKRPSVVLHEAQQLVNQGVEEIILVAQDLTAYGHDWGELTGTGLPALLDMLCTQIEHEPGRLWYRLMYAYPGHANERLVEVMATHKGLVVPYLDMPLQHGDRRVLKRMLRPHNMEKQAAFFRNLREAIPEIALRTTFIVGFPGETEDEFQGLLDFMTEMQFDKAGVFTFSPEPGTPAGAMLDQVPDDLKQERWERAMAHQQPIALRKQKAMRGQELEVLVDGVDEENRLAICRSYREAPEVDGYVLVRGKHRPGDRLKVRVTRAQPYDLEAKPLKRFPRRAVGVGLPEETHPPAAPAEAAAPT
ncbi:MAG TPA: 30S ribosomal protein S12 methylthiotransferase RimO, partial [Ardenticatenaceae bacterium]